MRLFKFYEKSVYETSWFFTWSCEGLKWTQIFFAGVFGQKGGQNGFFKFYNPLNNFSYFFAWCYNSIILFWVFHGKKNSMELKLCFSCSKFGELLLYELLTEIKLVELWISCLKLMSFILIYFTSEELLKNMKKCFLFLKRKTSFVLEIFNILYFPLLLSPLSWSLLNFYEAQIEDNS